MRLTSSEHWKFGVVRQSVRAKSKKLRFSRRLQGGLALHREHRIRENGSESGMQIVPDEKHRLCRNERRVGRRNVAAKSTTP